MPEFLWGLSGGTSLVAFTVSFPIQAEEVMPSAMAKLFLYSIWVHLSYFIGITSITSSLHVYVHRRERGETMEEQVMHEAIPGYRNIC